MTASLHGPRQSTPSMDHMGRRGGTQGMRGVARAAGVPLACVAGDLSMVRPLGRLGIPVALATTEPEAPMARSRYCREIVRIPGWVDDPDGSVDTLIAWARLQPHKPVLFYQGDHDMLAVSRHRERVAEVFHVVLPSAFLVETLCDKFRFAEFALERALPVPRTLRLYRGEDYAARLRDWDAFPAVLKPSMRTRWFERVGNSQKALRVESRADLDAAFRRLGDNDLDLLIQAAVEGGEEQIVSYHAYVRDDGSTAAEFTGRKLRTAPRLYGMSSHVVITDDAEVHALGRAVVDALGFTGVLKIDFKIDSRDGRLYLLEINPRFNLWHHPGTAAGVPIPAIVYHDCVGGAAATVASPAHVRRTGVRWVDPMLDRKAFREYRDAGELTFGRWLTELLTADVNEGFAWYDPAPGLASLQARIERKLSKWMGRIEDRTAQ